MISKFSPNCRINIHMLFHKSNTVPVFRSLAKNMIGNNTKINVDSVNGDTTVCVQIQPKSIMSDIDFVNNPNDSKSLSYATVGSESGFN